MSLQTVINYDTPGNFTYDANLIEIAAGKAQLKNQIETDETAFCSFTTKDLNRNAGGSPTGTLSGGAVIVSDQLRITSGTDVWSFNPTGMHGADKNKTTIRFKYIPQYSGTPAGTNTIYLEQESASVNKNQILFQHISGTGNLQVTLRDFNGTGKGTLIAIAGWSPVAGTIYEFEFDLDSSVDNSARFFLNGVPQGTHTYTAYTRSGTIGLAQFGGFFGAPYYIDDFQKFGAVRHTAGFPSEIPRTVSLTTYPTSNPTITPNSGILMDALEGFAEVVTKAGLDDVRTAFEKDGVRYWWNGAALAVSTGYAETNTAAEIEANKAAFVTLGVSAKPVIYLHSDDGSTTPSITSNTLDYSFFINYVAPGKCIVYGWIIDANGVSCLPAAGAVITFKSSEKFNDDGNGNLANVNASLTADSSGYFEANLPITDPVNDLIDVKIVYTDSLGKEQKRSFQILIPNQSTVEIDDIIQAA